CAPKSRARGSAGTGDDAFRARRALAVIDGTTLTAAARDGEDDVTVPRPASVKLRDAERLPLGEGYRIRRPSRAYGAPHVVEHLRAAIAIVRALYPDVHTLAIGDLSAEHGGKLANHLSHQTGLDVDLGFYFHQVPAGYPDRFVAANADLDLAATWSLLTAFARTSHLGDGVHMMFLDYGIQARLYAWARKRGTPDDQLAVLLQYPRGSDTLVGLVRHWPNHADHLHVRFKAAK
ncbi:MAG TPA: penicillin-insensitive murein endopeptidase, partial [Kofleriaceae bacterium]|nr:penicillin-insensitive murein endopeptidase [Kofleriaceae bacterium]